MERCPGTIVQPVTAYYSLGLHQKAEVSLQFGKPIHRAWQQLGRKTITTMLESALEDQLNEHRLAVIAAARGELAEYRSMLKAKRSTNEVFDAWMNGVTRWKSFLDGSCSPDAAAIICVMEPLANAFVGRQRYRTSLAVRRS